MAHLVLAGALHGCVPAAVIDTRPANAGYPCDDLCWTGGSASGAVLVIAAAGAVAVIAVTVTSRVLQAE